MEVGGVIGHAEVRIGDSVVMLFDRSQGPRTPAFLRLYVSDDATVLSRASERGARVVTEPTELFWGDRVSRFEDPFGNLWWIHQRAAEPSEEEINRRLGVPVLVLVKKHGVRAERGCRTPCVSSPTCEDPKNPRVGRGPGRRWLFEFRETGRADVRGEQRAGRSLRRGHRGGCEGRPQGQSLRVAVQLRRGRRLETEGGRRQDAR
ncbi:hypothetical protein GCM10025331_67110 [Actinoplanes utahensis]|nr:hypothetical protein Aut01nite_53350 [Actinoplanes utahensis]